MPAGLGEQKIARQNSNTVIETAVDGVHTTAGGGLVHDVVVHQRGGMDHLGDLRQTPVPAAQFAVRRERTGDQQNDAGAEPLAAGAEQVFGSSLEDRMTSADQAAQIAQQSLEVGLDGL